MGKRIFECFVGLRYGKDQQYEVISDEGRGKFNVPMWRVKCHKCAEDSELFGEAETVVPVSSVRKGSIFCGCGFAPRWSQEQYRIRVTRKCDEVGYKFIGFVGEWSGNLTKINVLCLKHDLIFQTSITAMLDTSKKCPECYRDFLRGDEAEYIAKFVSSGNFIAGSTFTRVPPVNGLSMWDVTCPLCSNDKYVKAGLCSGVFKSRSVNLEIGQRPCRCSGIIPLTREQMEFSIRERLSEKGLEFVRWDSEYGHPRRTYFTFNCPDHGDKTISVDSLRVNKHTCRGCGGFGFDVNAQGHLYVLKVRGKTCDFTGYGISTDLPARLSGHKYNLGQYGFTVEYMQTFPAYGHVCLSIETAISRNFEVFPQEVRGFKTEATHAHLYDDVVAFVQSRLSAISDTSKEPCSAEETCCV